MTMMLMVIVLVVSEALENERYTGMFELNTGERLVMNNQGKRT